MGAGDLFGFYTYRSDNTKDYCVKLSHADASAGGFGTEVDPLTVNAWMYNKKDLRHVTGFNVAKPAQRARLYCATPGNTLFVSGGTWTNSVTGRTYMTLGAEGERRPASHIGG